MTQTYQISFRNQFNSIKEGLILLTFTPIGLVIAHLAGIISWNDYPAVIIIMVLFNLLFFLPTFYLHYTYFHENSKTLLTVKSHSKCFSITNKNNTADYTFDDIHLAEQHLGIYYKNKIDHRGRWTTPWTGYGYFKLKLKNGQTYFFSSLMFDILNPPLPFSKTDYRFLPFIDKQELNVVEMRKWIEKEQQEKYDNYLAKFEGLPREILQEKVDNGSRYEPEAVEASKKLLEHLSNEIILNKQNNGS